MPGRNVIVFLSSVRPNRLADRVVKLVQIKLKAKGWKVTLFDPKAMNFEVVETPLHFIPDQTQAPQWLQDANEQIKAADAFLIISAEYNNSIPPALTNMLDHFSPASFFHRPCGIVTYSTGIWGGVRIVTPLFAVINEFGMTCLPTKLNIPDAHTNITPEGETTNKHIIDKLVTLSDDLDWYTEAFINHKKVRLPIPHSF